MRKNRLSAVTTLASIAGLACASSSAAPPAHPLVPSSVAWHNEQGDMSTFDPNWDGCTHPTTAWFHGVGDLPGGAYSSDARGVSPDGSVVVGVSEAVFNNGTDPAPTAFTFTACRGIAFLPTPGQPGFSSEALAASGDGSIVVGGGEMSIGVGCKWSSSGAVEILADQSGSLSTITTGVSVDGSTVVGSAFDASSSEAFIFASGSPQAQPLGSLPGGNGWSEANAISAAGDIVVGRGSSYRGIEAFRWTSGSGMIGLGGFSAAPVSSEAAAISADGATIVGSAATHNGRHAFLWTQAGGMVNLGDFSGGDDSSTALGVSADGSVVVGYGTTAHGAEAFIYDSVHGMQNLYDVLVAQNVSGLGAWTLTSANAVSADGRTIVGSGINPAGQPEGWVAHLAAACRADFNHDDVVNSLDFFDFLNAMYAGSNDFNHDGRTDTQDLFDFLAAFFAGC